MASNTKHPAPVILFDGVCNLCNAAVAWVIRHDRRGVFRFEPLQSEAGRAALQAANVPADLPDSIVLIDETGVHTRSDAAIRIARRLGFPWSLAVLALPLPRSIRDAMYVWIARNRYRWFGRRESCMIPTPDLAARFLHEHQDRPASSALPVPLPRTRDEAPASPISRFSLRFILAYLFISIFPSPLDLTPVLVRVTRVYDELWHSIIPWIGKHLLGIDASSTLPSGSGDTTYNYVETLVDVALALVFTIAWTLLAKGRPVFARVVGWSRIYFRYFLGITMLSYGWHKVMPIQFPFPGPDRLLMSYGDSSPMGLLWTFMGASPAYQMFAGLCEVLGGFLLLFRRTALLGAVISAGVLANIVAINFCYDVPVKLFSLHLLLIAAFLIAPDAVRLLSVLLFNLPAQPTVLHPFPIKKTWLRRVVLAVKLGIVGLFAVYPAFENYQYLKTDGLLKPRTDLHGFYRVESFVRGGVADRDNPSDALWVRVGINQNRVGAIQRADGTARRFRLEIDATKGTFTITSRGEPAPMTLNFSQPELGVIRVEGEFEGAPTVAVLRKQEADACLLTSRGFHWINEFPFNR